MTRPGYCQRGKRGTILGAEVHGWGRLTGFMESYSFPIGGLPPVTLFKLQPSPQPHISNLFILLSRTYITFQHMYIHALCFLFTICLLLPASNLHKPESFVLLACQLEHRLCAINFAELMNVLLPKWLNERAKWLGKLGDRLSKPSPYSQTAYTSELWLFKKAGEGGTPEK